MIIKGNDILTLGRGKSEVNCGNDAFETAAFADSKLFLKNLLFSICSSLLLDNSAKLFLGFYFHLLKSPLIVKI